MNNEWETAIYCACVILHAHGTLLNYRLFIVHVHVT